MKAVAAKERLRKALSDCEYTFSRSYDLTHRCSNMDNAGGKRD